MKLLEYQGKKLFKKYGVPIGKSMLVSRSISNVSRFTFHVSRLSYPLVLKSQVPVGERKRAGGVFIAKNKTETKAAITKLFKTSIHSYLPKKILAEEFVAAKEQWYLSFSYSTDTRTPVLLIAKDGGKPLTEAHAIPINLIFGITDFTLRVELKKIDIPYTSGLKTIIKNLWKLFNDEHALIAEINPLFVCDNDTFVAGDAKIILDDNVHDPSYRPLLELGGDIAILASGGGASLTNLDALMRHGGRPMNYVEYSGNPKADIVEALTKKVLSRPGIKGCWVIGGTANFTDIYETLTGFLNGIRKVKPKPTYPIVIRRDGPRTKEAFAMLREVHEKEGYDFHLFDSNVSMSDSGKVMTELAYKKPLANRV